MSNDFELVIKRFRFLTCYQGINQEVFWTWSSPWENMVIVFDGLKASDMSYMLCGRFHKSKIKALRCSKMLEEQFV